MSHRPYPTLDVKCVTTIIDILRRGAIQAEIKEFAKCSYELGGAALGIMVGEPEDVIVGAADVAAINDGPTEGQLKECHAALTGAELTLDSAWGDSGSDGNAEKLDPATVALIIQLALKALEFFLNRKKS